MATKAGSALDFAKYGIRARAQDANAQTPSQVGTTYSGYLQGATVNNNQEYSNLNSFSFSMTWTVPENPVAPGAYNYYWFGGINGDGYLVQPVLQWSENSWDVVAYAYNNGKSKNGPYTPVNSGDTLWASVVLDNGIWTVFIANQDGASSTVSLNAQAASIKWMSIVDEEWYLKLGACNQISPGFITYSSIALQINGQPTGIEWTPFVDPTAGMGLCGIGTHSVGADVCMNLTTEVI